MSCSSPWFIEMWALNCFLLLCRNLIIGPSAYLKEGWSWLDFLSTLTGYLGYLPIIGDGAGLNGLRALRALRPLRAIKAAPGG